VNTSGRNQSSLATSTQLSPANTDFFALQQSNSETPYFGDFLQFAIDASQSLRSNEEFLRRFFETTKIFSWRARADRSSFTNVGQEAIELLGYSLDEWREPDFWISHVHVDDRKRAADEYSNQLSSSDQFQLEYRITAKDGRAVWIHDMVSVQRKKGEPRTTSGFMIDVAEQKPSQDSLKTLSGRLIAKRQQFNCKKS
jgi:PAS domain S-box-containing protein